MPITIFKSHTVLVSTPAFSVHPGFYLVSKTVFDWSLLLTKKQNKKTNTPVLSDHPSF